MLALLISALLAQAYDPLNPGAAPPPPPARAPVASAPAADAGYLPRPATYQWPDLWPVNYQTVYRGRDPYGPGHWDLPTRKDPNWQRAYLDFPQQKIDYGMDPPGHRPEDFRDFGPGGVTGRIAQMKLGEVETWKGRAMKPMLRMVPYDGRFEVVGVEPVGRFACKQVKFTMSRPAKSVSLMTLYCQYSDGHWGMVT